VPPTRMGDACCHPLKLLSTLKKLALSRSRRGGVESRRCQLAPVAACCCRAKAAIVRCMDCVEGFPLDVSEEGRHLASHAAGSIQLCAAVDVDSWRKRRITRWAINLTYSVTVIILVTATGGCVGSTHEGLPTCRHFLRGRARRFFLRT